jgi:hypothetical protein
VFAPIYRFTFFRPGAIALFQAEYAVFGMNSAPYLIVNYLLHLGTALAGYRAFRSLDVGEWAAALGTGFFLVGFGHYGKTVIWAASGGTVVATLFCVLAAGLASGRLETVRSRAALAAVALTAPAFHEIGIVAGGLVLIRALAGRSTPRRWCALIAAVSISFWIITWVWVSRDYQIYGAIPDVISRMPHQLARYLSVLALPAASAADTSADGPWIYELIFRLSVPAGVVLAICLGYLAYRVRSTRFLILWVLAALFPFTLIGYPFDLIQLRYTYPAALPWCGLTGVLLVRLPFRRIAYALALIIVVYSASIHLFIERHYDRSTNDPLNRALADELRELQERVNGPNNLNSNP